MLPKSLALAMQSYRCLILALLLAILPEPVRSASARAQQKILRVAVQAEAKTLDPHLASDAASMRYLENMSCGLLRYDERYGNWQLDLAKELESSQDGLTYTFSLREAFFHNGRPISAIDVKKSIERIRRQAVRASHFQQVKSIEVLDERRLRITLHQAFPPFLVFLAHPMNAVIDIKAFELAPPSEGGFTTSGCGAFRPIHWQKQGPFRLQRFEQHYRYQPSPKQAQLIEFLPLSDPGTRSSALRSGAIDLLLDVPLKDVETFRADPDITFKHASGSFWEYVGLNNHRPFLANARIRFALALAVDRQQLNRIVKFGLSQPLRAGPIPPQHWAGLPEAIFAQPNPEEAKAILRQEGFDFDHEFELLVGSDFSYQVDAAIVLKQQLRQIGVKLKIQSLESGLFFYRLNQGNFDLAIVGWLGFVDPDEWFYEIFRSQGKWNQQQYSNANFDQLIEKARTKLQRPERQRLYWQAQRLLVKEAPMIFLYMNANSVAYRSDLKGYQLHPTGQSRSLESVTRASWGADR